MDGFQTLLFRHASRGVLIDTNLLLLYGIGLFDRDYVTEFKRTRQYTGDDFDWLHQFVAHFRRIITTPHILTELSNLAVGYRGPKPPPHLPVLLELIRATKELYVDKSVLLDAEPFAKFGMTDTAIIELARRKKYLVLTDEFPLAGYLQSVDCEVLNLNHIRTVRWFGA